MCVCLQQKQQENNNETERNNLYKLEGSIHNLFARFNVSSIYTKSILYIKSKKNRIIKNC